MLISTRGRYALRVVADLAEHNDGNYIPLKEISSRQEISLKYLEGIMTELSKAGIVEKCTVKSILEITEGSLSPVSCLTKKENDCPRKDKCLTLGMWKDLYELISDFFEKKTIKDLIK